MHSPTCETATGPEGAAQRRGSAGVFLRACRERHPSLVAPCTPVQPSHVELHQLDQVPGDVKGLGAPHEFLVPPL